MPDESSEKPNQEKGSSKEEIKREIKREIAEAIQGAGGGSDKKDDGKKEGGKDAKPQEKFRWTPAKVLGLVVLAVVVISVAVYYILYSSSHETTDDAYTTGYVHQISSRVTSNVTELLITDNQFVRQGQVLLRLDPRDYEVLVARAAATYERAKADFDRVDALKNDIAISKQDYDQTKANMEVAKANLDDANNQLGYCTIVAPTDGFIGNRTVETGNRVTVGGALMAVVQETWVVANFKETQLGKMKKGQRVKITIDAIPGHAFDAYVDSFAPGTGSAFALLPPDNATGNFTKIVQRVPVKILFEPKGIRDFRSRIVPGLSVEAAVDLDAPLRPDDNAPPKTGE